MMSTLSGFRRTSYTGWLSLTAAPRCGDDQKHSLEALPTFPAGTIDGVLLKDAYLFLECRHLRTIDGFGENCLIAGEIVAAHADSAFLCSSERDAMELILENPLMAYVSPGRFAAVSRTNAFPFPANMKK